MSSELHSLLLVRHAQANWGGADYDRLSPLGQQQAGLLGRWLASGPVAKQPKRIICGPRRRHRETADCLVSGWRNTHASVPTIESSPDWDDGDAAALLAAFRKTSPEARQLAYVAPGATATQGRALLRAVLNAWRLGALDGSVTESWMGFAQRISHAYARTLREYPGTTLVVTSAGAIARFAQIALALGDEAMIDLNLRLANTAISTFVADQESWQLSSWNCLPHLANQLGLPLISAN